MNISHELNSICIFGRLHELKNWKDNISYDRAITLIRIMEYKQSEIMMWMQEDDKTQSDIQCFLIRSDNIEKCIQYMKEKYCVQ